MMLNNTQYKLYKHHADSVKLVLLKVDMHDYN